jgi:3-methyl-2-oxobutanoate hydroxymethyltransferase
VIDDLLGLGKTKLRFVKKYLNLNQIIESGIKKYKSEVIKKKFPKAKHSF